MKNFENKIRICHFANLITGKSDGIYTHLKMLFKHLDNSKYEQHLVFQGNELIEREAKDLGVKVYVIPSLKKKFSIRSFIQFYSYIKLQKIDIIQTHYLKPYAIGGMANVFLRRKMIFNYHGLFIRNLYNTNVEQFIYRIFHLIIFLFKAVDLAIVPSFSSKEILYRETKLFPKIKTYYNGYDYVINDEPNNEIVNYFKNLKKSYFIIGMVARIEIEKRIDISLQIANKIKHTRDDVFFIFMGDGPLENEMKSFAHSLGLDDNVNFMGFIPNAKYYIKYFDLILFTSEWEGFPLTIWEAMASSIPIVSTDVGGIKEILKKEGCGFILSNNNIDDCSKTLLSLLHDGNRRRQMGVNGRNAILKKYNTSQFKSWFENLYSKLLTRLISFRI